MKLYNLKDHNEQVSFAQAVTQGLGKNQGLFFPHDLPEFSLTEIDEMLKLDFVTRSAKILSAFIGDEIPQEILEERVRAAFAFPAPVANVESDVGCLELFHRANKVGPEPEMPLAAAPSCATACRACRKPGSNRSR